MNCYQVETLIQMNVTFYDVALNLPADPVTVSLFVEDPNGNVSQIPANAINRTGTGAYNSMFLPTMPGQWAYKWQGTGNVMATSRDGCFFVQASDMVT